MSVEANKQIVRDFFAALASGDAQKAFSLVAEDVAWTVIGDTPVSKTYHGRKEIEEDLLGEAFRQIKVESGIGLDVVETIAEGDKVVARLQGKIEGKYGPYNNTYCHVLTVRAGKIVEDIEYLDTALIHKSLYGRKIG